MHCEGYEYEEFLDEIMEAPLSEPFFTRRMKMLSRLDGFMLCGKMLRLIRARPNFYMICDNHNVSLGIVDCSLYTRRFALKDDYHKKRMDSIPSKFYISDRLKQSKILDEEHTESLYSPSVPIIFPQIQKSFPSVLPKRVYPVSLRMHNKSAQRKPVKHKKTSRGKLSKRGSIIVSITYNLEAKKRHSGVRKRTTAH